MKDRKRLSDCVRGLLKCVGQPNSKSCENCVQIFQGFNPAVDENIVKAEGFLYV